MDKTQARASLSPAARLNLDTIARRGGRGRVSQAPMGRFTLYLPSRTGSLEGVHNVTGRTLRSLHEAGLIKYPDGDQAEPVALTETGWATAEPARAATP